MRRALLPVAAGCAALALVAAAGVVANRRQRAQELSPLPTVGNGGPRGLAAARAWLAATQRASRVLRVGDTPRGGEVLLLVAPGAPLDAQAAEALLSHAERGGLLVWAMGSAPQPALERRLGVWRGARSQDPEERVAPPLAPHPLFDGLALRTGGASLRAEREVALPVAGDTDHPFAASIPVGAGEVVVLAAPDALENYRLAQGDNLALLARLAAAGPIAFDERHLPAPGAGGPRRGTRAAAFAAQALLAAAALLLALGRRLGAVRASAVPPGGPTARDYLASLAGLYRRAGAEGELRAAAWRSLRRGLERRVGIAARLPDDQVASRLARRSPAAARAFERGLAALRQPAGEGSFVAVARAAGAVDAALEAGWRAPIGSRFVRPRGAR
ncbi:MAG TPA: DUF4350 domain-containing protein [Anaeromyxobacteraceae bacterium]|nr:DUF4350 domain-containing protein [Anaeromyxobacteraceae bacterium]